MPVASSYRWVILAVVFLSQISPTLSAQSVAPLAPILQSDLSLNKTQIGLFSAASYVGTFVVVMFAGALTDRYGTRKLMSGGQVIIAVFMMGMSTVGSLAQAAVIMFGGGLGCGLVHPSLSKAVADWFPRTSRGFAMGMKQAAVPLGGALTATTLPAIALALGWRPAMALVGVWIIVAAALTALFCRNFRRPGAGRDRGPSLLSGMQAVVRTRRVWTLSMVSLMFVAAQLALLTYLALFLDEVVLVDVIPDNRTRIIAAGGYLALCNAGGAMGRPFWGAISDRLFHGRRLIVLAIIGAISAVMSAVLSTTAPGIPLWLLSAIVFIFGIAAVGWNGLYQAAITEAVDSRLAATGVGLTMTISQLGTAGGPPLFGFIVDTTGSFSTGWLVMGLICVIGVIMALLNSRGEKVLA